MLICRHLAISNTGFLMSRPAHASLGASGCLPCRQLSCTLPDEATHHWCGSQTHCSLNCLLAAEVGPFSALQVLEVKELALREPADMGALAACSPILQKLYITEFWTVGSHQPTKTASSPALLLPVRDTAFHLLLGSCRLAPSSCFNRIWCCLAVSTCTFAIP